MRLRTSQSRPERRSNGGQPILKPIQLASDLHSIATATQRADDWWWQVSHWPRLFDRSQAITALTILELRCCGRDENDPLPLALREELR